MRLPRPIDAATQARVSAEGRRCLNPPSLQSPSVMSASLTCVGRGPRPRAGPSRAGRFRSLPVTWRVGEPEEPADDLGGAGDVRAQVTGAVVVGLAEGDDLDHGVPRGEPCLAVPGVGVDSLLVAGGQVEPGRTG